MKLTIGMACYDDFDGVYFTVQALRMYHKLKDTEILIVDNLGDDRISNWVKSWGRDEVRYERYTDIVGTTMPREMVFRFAKGEYVICIDSHVFIMPGALDEFRPWYDSSLIHGPMVYDNLISYCTHMEPVWRDNMWGIWADTVHKLPDEPFEIPMHGLGLFACRRNDWLGFNENFRGFGGEEGYIHEKFRQAGRKVMCLPWLKWMHKFRTDVPYPLSLNDRIRNYVIGFNELGLDLAPVRKHFGAKIVDASGEDFIQHEPSIPKIEQKNEVKKILFIGNGPAALSKEVGDQIDNFDGEVLRFNHYVTDGFEKYIGERTDIWFTCSNFNTSKYQHKKRYMATFASTDKDNEIADMIGAERIDRGYIDKTAKLMQHDHPSTGAVALQFFIDQGYEVWLWGFDFLDERKEHHYAKDGHIRGTSHKHDPEWLFFHKAIESGKAKWFGMESGESIPIIRQPEPCGHDDNIRWYREPAHNAWYKWFGEMSQGKTVLDIGCGVGDGMDVLRKAGVAEVLGIEVDDRLKSLGRNDIFTKINLSTFADNSFDVVTCVDVIEHVVKDLDLMDEMRRIARERIYITTPCYVRSRCGNIAHCREYTIPQFMNIFKPYEIWSASPDGSIHRTLVLRRKGGMIENWSATSYDNHIKDVELTYYTEYVPIDARFNQTADGEEWAHICGIFRV